MDLRSRYLTDYSCLSIGHQVLNDLGHAAAAVECQAAKLAPCRKGHETLNSLFVTFQSVFSRVVSKLALAIAALLFGLAQGHCCAPVRRFQKTDCGYSVTSVDLPTPLSRGVNQLARIGRRPTPQSRSIATP